MTSRMLDMTVDQLGETLVAAGHERYRAGQLADWVYRKGVVEPARMTNVPAAAAGLFDLMTSRIAARRVSADGCTKLLLQLHDGRRVETVMIPAEGRATACVSTQVGCAVGCAFCASGLDGLERNLACGEILEQVLHLQAAAGRKATNVVFMGMGEPLANYDATVCAVRSLVDPARFALSARRVTVSTVGLPGPIRRLAREHLAITLAISLHAPNDAIRRELIPAARRYPLDDVLAAAEAFYQSHKREITLEYTLLAGVNDSPACAEALGGIAGRLRCNVNLIGYNPVSSLPYVRPTKTVTAAFAARLRARGVNVTVRRSRGLGVDAACGQLRRRAPGDSARDRVPR